MKNGISIDSQKALLSRRSSSRNGFEYNEPDLIKLKINKPITRPSVLGRNTLVEMERIEGGKNTRAITNMKNLNESSFKSRTERSSKMNTIERTKASLKGTKNTDHNVSSNYLIDTIPESS